jgi:ubiquitin
VIPCDGCVIKTRANFNSAEHQLWDSRSADVILCRQCASKGQAGRPPREDDAEFLFCGGSCQRKLPITHFVDTIISLRSGPCRRCCC